MTVTGLIYVAIVALWAAVLIPMWLRRHDDDQARRIERHRVAMGTLARISDAADDARGAAARRRRLVLAGSATAGALGSAAWVAGFLPGIAAIALWLPFLVFLPATFLAERRASVRAAEVALEQRREQRARDSASTHRAEEPVAPAPRIVTPRLPSTRAASARTSSTRAASPRPAESPALAPQSSPAWDEVFDQTA